MATTPQDGNAPSASRSRVGRLGGALSRVGSYSALRATGRFFRRQLWAWPVVAAVGLAGVGWAVHRSVEGEMREQRAADLNVRADATAAAVRAWAGEQRTNAELIAADEQLRKPVAELLAASDGTPAAERRLSLSPAQDALRARLKPRLGLCGYAGFVVVAPGGVVLAADLDQPVGKALGGYQQEMYARAAAGRYAGITRPFRSVLLLPDSAGRVRANLPTMFTLAPVRNERGEPVAALGLRIRPEDNFTRLLEVVRGGASGDTYAFDRTGLLLSQSRFDDDLKRAGLLVDQPDSESILTVEVRDPGVNLMAGERPAARRSEQPLTRLAADAVEGRDGCDPDGYRGYRGVPKVGAWRWLPEYEMGIATEIDRDEAFRPVALLRRAFWSLVALLVLSAAGIFAFMLVAARQQRVLQEAALAARQLGQYALEEKLGAGGMGTVYRARHALLRRPTAVKLLNVEAMSEAAVARFEREVQLTGTLTHPNTVTVFDYGRTAEGLFYYAMEYLEGVNLDELVARAGPLPEARAVFLLRQVCGALAEAHASGLVHRDVKPANVFLTRRGGMYDFVKLLDFGLAKPLRGAEQAGLTSTNAIVGTPLYLAPEAVNDPERVGPRSDVYAVAAVAYFLLTGTPVFAGATAVEVCMKHAREAPEPPSARTGRACTPGLEALLMRCLSKSPDDRPADAGELLRELDSFAVAAAWTAADAGAWWSERGAGLFAGAPAAADPAGKDTSNLAHTSDFRVGLNPGETRVAAVVPHVRDPKGLP